MIKFIAWSKEKKIMCNVLDMDFFTNSCCTKLRPSHLIVETCSNLGDWHKFDDIADKFILLQYININDKLNNELYQDDIIYNENKNIIFRIYKVPGGFGIKAAYWSDNLNDLIVETGDDVIIESLADPQLKGFISTACVKLGNYNEHPNYTKQDWIEKNFKNK